MNFTSNEYQLNPNIVTNRAQSMQQWCDAKLYRAPQSIFGDLTSGPDVYPDRMDQGGDFNDQGKRPAEPTRQGEKEEPQRKRKRISPECDDAVFDIPEVPFDASRGPIGFETFAPGDCGVHSRPGETQGRDLSPLFLTHYFSNMDF